MAKTPTPAERQFAEHPERFDHYDIEPDAKRDSLGMDERVDHGVQRIKDGPKPRQ